MKKAIIIINEQHNLLPEQVEILENRFDSFELLKVPAEGWTKAEMDQIMLLSIPQSYVAVFASPIPYMIKEMVKNHDSEVLVFHNDNRDKKELPDGKVIYTVSKTGWELV